MIAALKQSGIPEDYLLQLRSLDILGRKIFPLISILKMYSTALGEGCKTNPGYRNQEDTIINLFAAHVLDNLEKLSGGLELFREVSAMVNATTDSFIAISNDPQARDSLSTLPLENLGMKALSRFHKHAATMTAVLSETVLRARECTIRAIGTENLSRMFGEAFAMQGITARFIEVASLPEAQRRYSRGSFYVFYDSEEKQQIENNTPAQTEFIRLVNLYLEEQDSALRITISKFSRYKGYSKITLVAR